MNKEFTVNNARIVKNTIVLYIRMIVLMLITLYTSRVTLRALGVEDYGLYNAVGGFVALFSVFSTTLTSTISRYVAVELGTNSQERLRSVFVSSLRVMLLLSIIVTIFAEIIGIWFINQKMQIPDGRVFAAIMVLHFSLATFVVSLISIPYNAVIVAHERMSAFAFIGILEAVLKLVVVLLLLKVSQDKLILYSGLIFLSQVLIRFIYSIYCHKNFEECNGKTKIDNSFFKDIWKFAGLSFLGNGSYILDTQGTNLLMNVYFGVVANAARGISNQVNSAVMQFVNSVIMSITPQIYKAYSSGQKKEAFKLACRGTKLSFFLLLFLSLPIIFEADLILDLWLVTPPEGCSSFVIWTIMATMTNVLGNGLLTLVNAEGNIKSYQIVMSILGVTPFGLTWLAYILGAPVISSYILYFTVFYLLIYLRLYLVNKKTGMPIDMFLKEVIIRVHLVCIFSVLPPLLLKLFVDGSVVISIFNVLLCFLSVSLSVFILGLTDNERHVILIKAKNKLVQNEKH